MNFLSALLGFSGPPPPPRTTLTEAERDLILAELEKYENSNNERFSRIEDRLNDLVAEAGLEQLRDHLGRPHG